MHKSLAIQMASSRSPLLSPVLVYSSRPREAAVRFIRLLKALLVANQ